MNVRGGGVNAEIDTEGFAGLLGFFQLGGQVGFGDDFGYAFFEVGELFGDGFFNSSWS